MKLRSGRSYADKFTLDDDDWDDDGQSVEIIDKAVQFESDEEDGLLRYPITEEERKAATDGGVKVIIERGRSKSEHVSKKMYISVWKAVTICEQVNSLLRPLNSQYQDWLCLLSWEGQAQKLMMDWCDLDSLSIPWMNEGFCIHLAKVPGAKKRSSSTANFGSGNGKGKRAKKSSIETRKEREQIINYLKKSLGAKYLDYISCLAPAEQRTLWFRLAYMQATQSWSIRRVEDFLDEHYMHKPDQTAAHTVDAIEYNSESANVGLVSQPQLKHVAQFSSSLQNGYSAKSDKELKGIANSTTYFQNMLAFDNDSDLDSHAHQYGFSHNNSNSQPKLQSSKSKLSAHHGYKHSSPAHYKYASPSAKTPPLNTNSFPPPTHSNSMPQPMQKYSKYAHDAQTSHGHSHSQLDEQKTMAMMNNMQCVMDQILKQNAMLQQQLNAMTASKTSSSPTVAVSSSTTAQHAEQSSASAYAPTQHEPEPKQLYTGTATTATSAAKPSFPTPTAPQSESGVTADPALKFQFAATAPPSMVASGAAQTPAEAAAFFENRLRQFQGFKLKSGEEAEPTTEEAKQSHYQ